MSNTSSLLARLDGELKDGALSGAIGILTELSRAPMTVATLKASRAGIRVAKLRHHADSGVANCAKECLRVWKRVAEESGVTQRPAITASAGAPVGVDASIRRSAGGASRGRASGDGGKSTVYGKSSGDGKSSSGGGSIRSRLRSSGGAAGSAGGAGAGAGNAGMSLPAAIAAAESAAATAAAASSLRATPRARVKDALRTDLILTVLTYQDSREGRLEVSAGGLAAQRPETIGVKAEECATAIEAALFEAHGDGKAYAEQFKRLMQNLKKNTLLTMNIFYGFVLPRIVATLTSDDMRTEEAKKAAAAVRKAHGESVELDWKQRNRQELLSSAGLKNIVDQGQPCKRCKSRNTEFLQKQMLPGDEPMTLFFYCNECSFRWTFT